MVSKLVLVLFSILLVTGGKDPAWHEFYVSVCYIRNLEDHLEVNYRIFKDDLDSAIESNEDNYCQEATKYLLEHFKVAIDGRTINWSPFSCQLEGEGQFATYTCVLRAEAIPDATDVHIESSVLLDVIDDQINMMHYLDLNDRKSVNLDNRRTSADLKLGT